VNALSRAAAVTALVAALAPSWAAGRAQDEVSREQVLSDMEHAEPEVRERGWARYNLMALQVADGEAPAEDRADLAWLTGYAAQSRNRKAALAALLALGDGPEARGVVDGLALAPDGVSSLARLVRDPLIGPGVKDRARAAYRQTLDAVARGSLRLGPGQVNRTTHATAYLLGSPRAGDRELATGGVERLVEGAAAGHHESTAKLESLVRSMATEHPDARVREAGTSLGGSLDGAAERLRGLLGD